jgi:predicted secreted protein
MVAPPPKKLRWGRIVFALVLLAAIVGGVIYLVTHK